VRYRRAQIPFFAGRPIGRSCQRAAGGGRADRGQALSTWQSSRAYCPCRARQGAEPFFGTFPAKPSPASGLFELRRQDQSRTPTAARQGAGHPRPSSTSRASRQKNHQFWRRFAGRELIEGYLKVGATFKGIPTDPKPWRFRRRPRDLQQSASIWPGSRAARTTPDAPLHQSMAQVKHESGPTCPKYKPAQQGRALSVLSSARRDRPSPLACEMTIGAKRSLMLCERKQEIGTYSFSFGVRTAALEINGAGKTCQIAQSSPPPIAMTHRTQGRDACPGMTAFADHGGRKTGVNFPMVLSKASRMARSILRGNWQGPSPQKAPAPSPDGGPQVDR